MYPQIKIELFDTSFVVNSYLIFAILGATIFNLKILPFLIREGLSWFRTLIFLTVWNMSFLAGARGLNYLVNRHAYENGLQLLSFYFAGFSFYGGALSVLVMTFVLSHFFHIHVWKLLDQMIIPSSLAFISARIGCFLAGCCSGKATDSFLGVVFPRNEAVTLLLDKLPPFLLGTEIAVYPTQLFEAGLALIGLVLVLIYCKSHKPASGTQFLLYSVWFTFMRLLILPVRNLPYSDEIINFFYPILYLTLILLGVYRIVQDKIFNLIIKNPPNG